VNQSLLLDTAASTPDGKPAVMDDDNGQRSDGLDRKDGWDYWDQVGQRFDFESENDDGCWHGCNWRWLGREKWQGCLRGSSTAVGGCAMEFARLDDDLWCEDVRCFGNTACRTYWAYFEHVECVECVECVIDEMGMDDWPLVGVDGMGWGYAQG